MPRTRSADRQAIETRFLLWFNGNGIPEKYWIPRETGADYELTPCLKPLDPFRNDVHVISGLDNPNGQRPSRRMSALMSGEAFTGRGAGGPSIDQVIARRSATSRASARCRSASARNRSARTSIAT